MVSWKVDSPYHGFLGLEITLEGLHSVPEPLARERIEHIAAARELKSPPTGGVRRQRQEAAAGVEGVVAVVVEMRSGVAGQRAEECRGQHGIEGVNRRPTGPGLERKRNFPAALQNRQLGSGIPERTFPAPLTRLLPWHRRDVEVQLCVVPRRTQGFDLAGLGAQEGEGHADQRHVTRPAQPVAPLEMVQPELSFEFTVVLLDAPLRR